MLVNFQAPWFAPSEGKVKDKIRVMSGRFFRKGIHEVDEELRAVLPKTAKIIEAIPVVEEEKKAETLKDFDQLRKDADAYVEKEAEAEKTLLEQRQERMAKAREVAMKVHKANKEKKEE